MNNFWVVIMFVSSKCLWSASVMICTTPSAIDALHCLGSPNDRQCLSR